MIVWDLHYSLSEPDFWISFWESYHKSSNFALCPYFKKFKWLYFGTAWRYSHTVWHAGSPTLYNNNNNVNIYNARSVSKHTESEAYVDVTLTRSKVKVAEHLNVRQLSITTHFQVYLLRHFLVELKTDVCQW